MLILISPAKKLLSLTKPYSGTTTQPRFLSNTHILLELMKLKSKEEIASLMSLSQDLAKLNYDRYQHFFSKQVPLDATYPALFLFQGDVYQGLQVNQWSQEDVQYAQSHIAILSGLYGLLRPLDAIQPYRLEMGTRLENPKGKNLYNFWSEVLTDSVNEQLSSHECPYLINLASTEYFKVINSKKLKHPLITINFYEQKNNEVKMVGILSKKARGLMTRFIIQNRISTLAHIKEFAEQGYHFNNESSSATHLDFIRIH